MDQVDSSSGRAKTRSRKMRARTPEAKAHVLQLAERLGSVSRACQIMGYSRDSYYRFKRRYEAGGILALERPSRKKPLLKNRVAKEVEDAVVQLATLEPAWGRAKVAETLCLRGLRISPSGVRCVWLRHHLETVAQRKSFALQESRAPSMERTTAEGPSAAANEAEEVDTLQALALLLEKQDALNEQAGPRSGTRPTVTLRQEAAGAACR